MREGKLLEATERCRVIARIGVIEQTVGDSEASSDAHQNRSYGRDARPRSPKRASAAAEGKRRCTGQQCGIDVAVDAARLGKADPQRQAEI